MLGISPNAWEEAQTAMGDTQVAIVVAAILQKSDAIASAGGYLRGLTPKADEGGFCRADADGADRWAQAREEAGMTESYAPAPGVQFKIQRVF